MKPHKMTREEQREKLFPLIQFLRKRFKERQLTNYRIAEELGWAAGDVQRITGHATQSPSWTDLTQLLNLAGITPNEAALLVGFLDPAQAGVGELSPEERDLVRLYRTEELTDEERERLFNLFAFMVRGYQLPKGEARKLAREKHPKVS